MEIDEIRLLDGYGKQKKIRATSADRIAGEIYSIEYIRDVDDIHKYVSPMLPDGAFIRNELSRALKLKALNLWGAQNLLIELQLIKCQKDGRRLLFEKMGNN